MNARKLLSVALFGALMLLLAPGALAQNRSGGGGASFVVALEAGAMATSLDRLDDEFHRPNGALPFETAPVATLNAAAMLQVGSVLRIGGVFGFAGSGSEYTTRQLEFSRIGARLEVGYGTEYGWGFWVGGEYFWGRLLTTSRDNAFQYDGIAGFYDYEARGSGMRFSANLDIPVFYRMKLRVSPFIEHFASSDEVYTVNVSDRAPEPVLPATDSGPAMHSMGLTLGVVFVF